MSVRARVSVMLLTVIAAVAMFIPKREQGQDITPEDLKYNKPLAAGMSLAVGVFDGMVGAPGAFIYIPVMIYLLNIPIRIVIGSTLGIVFFGAIAGTIGKMATGQIMWPVALALVVGTIPGAQFGGGREQEGEHETSADSNRGHHRCHRDQNVVAIDGRVIRIGDRSSGKGVVNKGKGTGTVCRKRGNG